jgi:hypothetical protein
MAIGFCAANCVCVINNIAKLSEVRSWLIFVVISRVCFQSQELIEWDVLFNIIPREQASWTGKNSVALPSDEGGTMIIKS